MDSLSECGDWKNRTSLDLHSPFSSRELFREAGLLTPTTMNIDSFWWRRRRIYFFVVECSFILLLIQCLFANHGIPRDNCFY